jgi:hypothetical protein
MLPAPFFSLPGMTVEGLLPYLKKHREKLLASLCDGTDRPSPLNGWKFPN